MKREPSTILVLSIAALIAGCNSEKAPPPAVVAPPSPTPAVTECGPLTSAELSKAIGTPVALATKAPPAKAGETVCAWQDASDALHVELHVERLASADDAKKRMEPLYTAGGGVGYTSYRNVADECVAVIPTSAAKTVKIAWRLAETVSVLTVERSAGLDATPIADGVRDLIAHEVGPAKR
jgi:hypothetical protein